ncbi:MAG: UTP--glucose-1-phosphate uridylyltransferase [Planctomycetota bacterium]
MSTAIEVDVLKDELETKLSAFDQQHILAHWAGLDETQRRRLADDINSIDLEQIQRLYANFGDEAEIPTDASAYEEPDGFALADPTPRFTREQAQAAGEAALQAGTVGVVIVAGGQGTRLGFAHPKGMYPIAPNSKSTLFEILIGKVRAASTKYNVSIPVYLMTSPATHQETVDFLNENDRFGLAEDELVVFCQGTMPAVTLENGKLLLAEKDALFRSPDGHGGMLQALESSGSFRHMKQRGIEHLFYLQIDNPLVDIAGADAIGYHVLANSEATTVVIRKTDPLEKVGNIAVLDNKTQVVEYSDLPEQVAKLRRDDGSLLLWAGNVAVHVWDVSFLEQKANSTDGLPFHYARKKVPFVSIDGTINRPTEPNGVKFERFIFDLLPEARRSIVVEVDRGSYFAPLKNPTGSPGDTPESVAKQMSELHRQWIEAAGGTVNDGVTVEIQPSYANSAEDVAAKLKPGTTFDSDTILS